MDNNKYTILVVDDEPSLKNALSEKLQKEKYNVLTASNGEEGVAMALTKHPDLILLDIVMPKMDGITMLKKIREDSWGKDASVLVLSNLSDPVKVEESGRQGVSEYLIKTDWTLEELLKKIEKKLK